MRLTTCAASGYIIVHTSSNVLVLFFLTFAGTLVLFYVFVVLSRAALSARHLFDERPISEKTCATLFSPL